MWKQLKCRHQMQIFLSANSSIHLKSLLKRTLHHTIPPRICAIRSILTPVSCHKHSNEWNSILNCDKSQIQPFFIAHDTPLKNSDLGWISVENVIKFSFGVTPTAPNTSRWPMSPSMVNSAKRNKDKPTAYVSSFSIIQIQLITNPSKYSAFNALSDYITNKQNLADFRNEHFLALIPRKSDFISLVKRIYN